MAQHNNQEVLERYLEEAGRTDAHFLSKAEYNGDGLRYEVDRETHTFSIRRRQRIGALGTRIRGEVIPMIQFAGKRHGDGVFVVNGDGFDDGDLNRMQEVIRNQTRARLGAHRMTLLPYAALNGAQLDRATVRAIEVSEDTQENFQIFLPPPFDQRCPSFLLEWADMTADALVEKGAVVHSEGARDRTLQFTLNGAQYQVRMRKTDDGWDAHTINVWAQPDFGQWGWQRCVYVTSHWHMPKIPNADGDGSYGTGWTWTEQVHRLGAVVFSAVTAVDGRRHRYVSAFDMQETNGLYFLAMLPDRGTCKTYVEALDLLAPDMVHVARREGRAVYRQGDVFAIETKRTNEEVYRDAITRVRRGVALQDAAITLGNGRVMVEPAEGEVVEVADCPFCAGHTLSSGWGDAARRALSIHRTGHTASEVVVKEGGVTYVRGNMYHDPHIEDPSRREADHNLIQLGPLRVLDHVFSRGGGFVQINDEYNVDTLPWFVAIRNTVPKLRPRSRPNEDSEILATSTTVPQLREHERAVEENAASARQRSAIIV